MIDKKKREEIARFLFYVAEYHSAETWEGASKLVRKDYKKMAGELLSLIVADDQTIELIEDTVIPAPIYGDKIDITTHLQAQASKMIRGDGKTKWMKIKI